MLRRPIVAATLGALVVSLPIGAGPSLGAPAPAEWSAPHAVRHSTYFINSDLGRDNDAVGGWLARVAVNGAGTAAVGYQRQRSVTRRPAAAVRHVGGSWASRVFTRNDHSGYSWVGVNRRGRVTAVWLNQFGARQSVQWAQRRPGGGWTDRRTLRGWTGVPPAST